MAEDSRQPLAAEARTLARAGEWQQASEKLCQLIGEVTGVQALTLQINRDQYSLNSLNGRVTLADDRTLFFKYHHEEGEDHTIEEYYRAELLREHGFRVDVPLYACGEPGRQILLYRLRDDRRLADVCRDIELQPSAVAEQQVIEAQRRADAEILQQTLPTLQAGRATEVAAEPIHQLFYHRLITPGEQPGLGGRVKQFYVDKNFQLGDQQLSWQTLSNLQWEINGVRYHHTLRQLFLEAATTLAPAALAQHGVVVAHGDAHNANVWFETHDNVAQLVSFDPAFAGSHIPALLAEIKATFHNIFAHPCWLYEPALAADLYQVAVTRTGDTLQVSHNWQLTSLRAAFLRSKGDLYWRPLLNELRSRGLLPGNWQRIMRLALFCCPTLVLDLRAAGGSGHTPTSSALGLAIAVMLGSEGDDEFDRWLQQLV
ncbi:hypothetical protein J2125_003689 [Erwinia toletana]|uniref:Aminoglycoside phosphotransferase domain-containing protein n=1 Tax=Winslowiella toletana TaxID=92490 RepID=A0ABS4PE64_9GAMM|nr:hypothetical protein [Winslowiella toletana]MBP2170497.1 hypothetical protein [Winslowiella toletana]